LGTSLDYKFTPFDRVSLGFQYSSFDGQFVVSNVNFNGTAVLPGFTTTSSRATGTLSSAHQERQRFNRTFMPNHSSEP